MFGRDFQAIKFNSRVIRKLFHFSGRNGVGMHGLEGNGKCVCNIHTFLLQSFRVSLRFSASFVEHTRLFLDLEFSFTPTICGGLVQPRHVIAICSICCII